jgi:hypothetical protein
MSRFLLVAAAGAAAAMFAGSASAAPALAVKTSPLVRAAAATTITTRESPGTYRTTIFAPAAFQLPALRHIDQQFGSATVHVATVGGPLTFTGWIAGENPGDFILDQCAAFAGDLHPAVWVMHLRQTNGIASAEIPIYVDYGPGGSTELTWCASSAADMTVTGVSISLGKALLNPIAPGAYAWRGLFDNVNADSRSTQGAITTSATAVVRVRRK